MTLLGPCHLHDEEKLDGSVAARAWHPIFNPFLNELKEYLSMSFVNPTRWEFFESKAQCVIFRSP